MANLKYVICLSYLHFLLETIKYIGLPGIFVHADKRVYPRILHLRRNERNLYSNISLMRDFHQLHVFQKIPFNYYGCLSFQDLLILEQLLLNLLINYSEGTITLVQCSYIKNHLTHLFK